MTNKKHLNLFIVALMLMRGEGAISKKIVKVPG